MWLPSALVLTFVCLVSSVLEALLKCCRIFYGHVCDIFAEAFDEKWWSFKHYKEIRGCTDGSCVGKSGRRD